MPCVPASGKQTKLIHPLNFNSFFPILLQLNLSYQLLNFLTLSHPITMQVSRTAARVAARSARAPVRINRQHVRFATTNQQAAAAGGSSGLVGGLAGGALVFAV